MKTAFFILLTSLSLLLPTAGPLQAGEGEWSGHMATQLRLFPESPLSSQQGDLQLSVSFQPEYYQSWDEGNQSFAFVPFIRLDSMDSERSHWDIRELTWMMVGDNWELRTGIRKLYWGVTESQHLVDIINQTDGIESIDGEKKLGQPMINLSLTYDIGTLDFFLLPYFRERTYPGQKGRLRSTPWVDTDQARYESSAKAYHLDWAARWFKSLGDWDVGLSHFSGTSRSPTFVAGNNSSGNSVLLPYYPLMEQTGLDLQVTKEAWLWKLEAISSRSQGSRYSAMTGGFEYTFVGVMNSDSDVGLIAEYLFDDRGERAPTPMESDIMIGLRLAMNDVNSTDFLIGTIVDINQHHLMVSMEGSRRVMSNWKLSVEGRFFVNTPAEDTLYSLRRDSFFQVELARYF
ncbi:MAG: hypothetical protein HQL72_06655 [Magnetococcales bacterium]|nr:hypothetical protein [Magnetococcales bacterium]